MNYQYFEKTAKLPWGKIGIGAGIVGTGVGGALIGHAAGKKKGSKQMVEKFKEYNSKENSAIAQRAYNMGKQAELEEIALYAMEDEMHKIAAINPKVAKGLAIGGGLIATGGVGAALGFAGGKKKGGEATKKKLINYNQAENRAIAERAYNMGKQAELEDFYVDCFNDELQKLAAPSMKGIGEGIKSSFSSLKNIGTILKTKTKDLNRLQKLDRNDLLKSEFKKAAPALGIIGAAGGTGLIGAGAIAKSIKNKKTREQ